MASRKENSKTTTKITNVVLSPVPLKGRGKKVVPSHCIRVMCDQFDRPVFLREMFVDPKDWPRVKTLLSRKIRRLDAVKVLRWWYEGEETGHMKVPSTTTAFLFDSGLTARFKGTGRATAPQDGRIHAAQLGQLRKNSVSKRIVRGKDGKKDMVLSVVTKKR